MNNRILFIGVILLLPLINRAQDFTDALRYSSVRLEGTARSGAMGNAFGALGGDFTSLSINPAGLGVYRAGEFAFTPNFAVTDINASYLGTSMNDNRYRFGFSNLSYVASLKSGGGNESGLVGVNFGIGYNRLRDFNNNAMTEGANANSSFMDYIAENANYGDFSDFYEELAYKVDVLQYDTQLKEYWHDIQDAGYGHSQRKSYRRNGALDEYTIGLGLNFSHRFYLGASLGIVDLYYKESTTLKEWDQKNNIPFLNDYQFNTFLRTSSTGYNFKLGAIFKPINELRLGLSVHTPTFFNMRDNFETSMASSITYEDNSTKRYDESSPFMEYDYSFETPVKATLSAAYVFSKKGLFSVDYEYLNYGKAKLRNGGDGEDFVGQNRDIAELYKPVGNIRVGGEYRITDPFSLRAGFEYYPSAFNSNAFGQKQPNADMNYSVYSAGFGYKSGGFFVDVAWRYTITGEYNLLYPSPLTSAYPVPEMAKFDQNINKLLITLGFRF